MTHADAGRWASLEAGPIFEAAPDAMVLVDEAGTILLVNAQTERLFSWPRAELVGRPIETLLPERYRAGHAAHRASYARAPHTRPMGASLDLHGRRRDGSEFPVEIALSPIATEHGRLVSAAIRDISERRAAERAATVARERLLTAIEVLQDPFAVFDEHDRLLLCNSAYRASLPRDWEGAVVGAQFEALLDASLAEEVPVLDGTDGSAEQYRARRLGYHRAPEGALDVRTRDGRSLRFVDRVTPDGGRIATIYDLTADARRAAEIERARESAEAANAAKTEFLRSMSHELRTPLNAVLGFAQLLERDPGLGERPRRLVAHVKKGGEHLLRLIDDVLDLARVESGNIPLSLEPVVIGDVLDEVRATLQPLAERRGISLFVALPETPLPPVRADRTRLAQVVLNFGSNAIKYGRAAGRVVLGARLEGDRVRVVVTDDGPGIPLDRQDRLFTAFYRAGQETGPIEGTGIGLALCRRLAAMMDGGVGFESRPDHGSSFWIELPLDRSLSPPAPRAAAGTAARLVDDSTGEAVVLYVEDNPANVAFMEELCAGLARIRLVTAPTGELGLELARALRPAVIVLDINLPGVSGFEVLRRLRALDETAHIPVLALSASAMDRDVRRAEAAGFARYLTKPVKVDEFVEALEAQLQAGR